MSMTLSWWSVLGAVPYILDGVAHPYTQVALYRLQSALRGSSGRRLIVGTAALAIALGMTPAVSGQSRGGQQRSRQQTGTLQQNPAQVPIVAGDFKGTLRSIERKRLRLDVGEDQSVEFVRDHKTKFLRGDQEVQAKEIPEGTSVTIEATKHPSGDLVALRVIAAPAKP